MKSILTLLFGLLVHLAQAQLVSLRVEDSLTHEPLAGVTIQINTTPPTGLITNDQGTARMPQLPRGSYRMKVHRVGYDPYNRLLTLTTSDADSIPTIRLSRSEEALEEVTVTATRTNSRLEDLPIKVEVLGQEEMNEEAAVVPGNIASILGDISIIHIQRTSLPTGNAAIRMQGLDPKYTQILRDGLPLYEGFSGNLGVLQIPPLDLKQVEIVKGSASTLYGGGAIGGLINLVSRRPGAEPELTAVLNHSTLRETNLNAYYGQQWGKVGLTVFGGYTNQPAVDVNQDGYADSPLIHQLTFHPRLFLNPGAKDRFNVGYNLVSEKRTGGDIQAIHQPEGQHTYVVDNISLRHSVDATFDHAFSSSHSFTGRGTLSFFNRTQNDGGFRFAGRQRSGYTEWTDNLQRGAHTLISGLNLTWEQFHKMPSDSSRIRDFNYLTTGFFVQDDYRIGRIVTVQGGLRLDHHNVFGNFFLPRLSILTKPGDHWSIRTSVGTGYKTPNVFANLTGADARTSLRYQYLQPLSPGLKPERSVGLNMDIAYQGTVGEDLTIQLDQAFYYTSIQNPILAVTLFPDSLRQTTLRNASYAMRSLGTDTYLRLDYKAIELYVGFNHTAARRGSAQRQGPDRTNVEANTYLPFSPRDKFSLTLAYSIPDKWRFGIESSWVGNQYLYDNQRVPNYWFWAAAVERVVGRWHLILNAENLFNVQQIQYGPVVTGSANNLTTAPLWAPQEGRIVNLALKYQLR